MLNVEKEMEQPHAHAIQDYKEIHMLNVSMNAPSTQSVPQTWPVYQTSVEIHVQESAEPMHHAVSTTTSHHVHVIQDTQEILSQHVIESQHVRMIMIVLHIINHIIFSYSCN